MCGICGSLGFREGSELVQKMTTAMLHRGPDSSGYFTAGAISLGIRRLSIIDLVTGDQPVFNEDRSIAAILNGEIYNYRLLRNELEQLGHRFVSSSDSETLVHAYEAWGLNFLERLHGMFAIAILDQRSRLQPQLLLARDRLGIKPLYLFRQPDRLLFASEVRSLLACGKIARRASLAGIYSYLAFGSVQEPLTLIDGVTSLPPASWLKINLVNPDLGRSTLDFQVGFYWKPPIPNSNNSDQAVEIEARQVRQKLSEAVTSHLASDVPLGVFLSGGLDSGTIVALAGEFLKNQLNTNFIAGDLRTFTLGFTNWPLDERSLAEATARYWGAHQQSSELAQTQYIVDLPAALQSMDQPTVDGINTWYVARAARQAGLKVALSGLGGDEIFAGYPAFRLVPRLKRFPKWVKKAGLMFISPWLKSLRKDGGQKLSAYFQADPLYIHPYFAVRGLFWTSQIQGLLNQRVMGQLKNDPGLEVWKNSVQANLETAQGYDDIAEVSWLELSQYTLSTLLRDADMMSMAHSLEVRVPFLDHRLVEFLLLVDQRSKYKPGQLKPLLAQAMRNDLPPTVLAGKKRTFSFPYESWLRTGLSSEVEKRLLAPEMLSEWFNPLGIAQVWQEFLSGRTGWARPWSLYVLDQWLANNL